MIRDTYIFPPTFLPHRLPRADSGPSCAVLGRDSRRANQSKNEGEGNKTADRHYREGVRRHVESGASEPAAKEAERALDSEAGDALRRAEDTGTAGRNTR